MWGEGGRGAVEERGWSREMEQVMEPKGWRLAGARVGGNKKGRVRE